MTSCLSSYGASQKTLLKWQYFNYTSESTIEGAPTREGDCASVQTNSHSFSMDFKLFASPTTPLLRNDHILLRNDHTLLSNGRTDYKKLDRTIISTEAHGGSDHHLGKGFSLSPSKTSINTIFRVMHGVGGGWVPPPS